MVVGGGGGSVGDEPSPLPPFSVPHLFQNPDVRLSKALSYVLRHGAAQLGLEMGAGKCTHTPMHLLPLALQAGFRTAPLP